MYSGDVTSPHPGPAPRWYARALPTNAGRRSIFKTISEHLPFSFACRAAALGVVATVGCCVPVAAQNYPNHVLRLIVPLAPGGGNDGAARIVGHNLGEALGEQIVVDNRPGGSSII